MVMRHSKFFPILATAVIVAGVSSGDVFKGPKQTPPAFDQAAMVDVKGTVVEVREAPELAFLAGIHLIVKAGNEKLDVFVGPKKLLKLFNVTFAEGDVVRVIGSKVANGEMDLILASELHRGKLTLTLRDGDGTPVWKDWAMGF
jgi:hypothetical protein